ncbi:MAG: tetratricopeptide repeat protein [Bacteroidales bacterium]|jgi:tetratricopeptide (TPR) repeat protein|nr:tetratricopeptide repeat protein [Bacteroidales bacterium]
MDILRKFILIPAIVLVTTINICAQDNKAVLAAFKTSYTYENSGDYSKAIDAVKGVYSADNYWINIRLGWLTYMSGLFTESIAYYQKSIKLMPVSIEAKLGLALPASALGNWDLVKTTYLEILKTDPNHSLTNYRMGLLYYGRNDYGSAYKYFEKVVNLYPFDYDSVLMFAWTNFKSGKIREAQILFNRVLVIKPDDASALEGLSYIK